jgi:serine/threonine protein kinase
MSPAALAMTVPLAWPRPGAPRRGLEPAPRIAGYRMLRELGAGRRSGVWLARDARGGEVVLKLQPAEGSNLHREWEVASALEVEHVVRVHAHGRAGAWAWLAMEHVAGGDLARRMRGGIAPAEALSLLRQAAVGLAQLHRRGWVHRDVKPANFLLRPDGTLVLADFGLVARSGAAAAGLQQGVVTGTPRYVAPEQLQGGPATAASDVYGLGVLLHEMLCGRPPFAGVTLMEVLSQHLLAEPPRLPPGVGSMQPLLDRMLAKEVQSRLRDADAVLGLLAHRWFS